MNEIISEIANETAEAYVKQKLRESIFSSTVSTIAHILLLLLLAIFVKSSEDKPQTYVEIVSQVEKLPEKIIPLPKPIDNATELPDSVSDSIDNTPITANDLATALEQSDSVSTDDNSKFEAISELTSVISPTTSASVYGGNRSKGARVGLIAKGGGNNKRIEPALDSGLDWLAKVQLPDGSWGTQYKNAHTGLALLSYLARGETTTSVRYGKTVEKAIKWLVNSNNENDGHEYAYSIKLYALAEAYAMTGNYSLEQPIIDMATRLVNSQLPNGGYSYNFNSNLYDMSFSGWAFQALKATKVSGVEIKNLDLCIDKIKTCLLTEATSGYGYNGNGTRQSEGLRGAGIMTSGLLDILKDKNDKIKPEYIDVITKLEKDDIKKLDWNNPPNNSMYSWYYETFAAFQIGGNTWVNWRKKFEPMLLNNKTKEGYWVYPGNHHPAGNDLDEKIHATSLAILTLTVYFRFAPSTTHKKQVEVKEEKVNL